MAAWALVMARDELGLRVMRDQLDELVHSNVAEPDVIASSAESKTSSDLDPEPFHRLELRFYGADASLSDGLASALDFVDYLRVTLRSGGFRALAGKDTAREKRQLVALTIGVRTF